MFKQNRAMMNSANRSNSDTNERDAVQVSIEEVYLCKGDFKMLQWLLWIQNTKRSCIVQVRK